MREEIRSEALRIKAQLAREFEQRHGHVTQADDYYKSVVDFLTEKMCLMAARTRILEVQVDTLEKKLGINS